MRSLSVYGDYEKYSDYKYDTLEVPLNIQYACLDSQAFLRFVKSRFKITIIAAISFVGFKVFYHENNYPKLYIGVFFG